jgi:hypothetical protein
MQLYPAARWNSLWYDRGHVVVVMVALYFLTQPHKPSLMLHVLFLMIACLVGTNKTCLNSVCHDNDMIPRTTTPSPGEISSQRQSANTVTIIAVVASVVVACVIAVLVLVFVIGRRRVLRKRTELEHQLAELKTVHRQVIDLFESQYQRIAASDERLSSMGVFEDLEISRKLVHPIRVIGEGHFGVVRLASLDPPSSKRFASVQPRTSASNQLVAIKSLQPAALKETQVQFCLEARLLNALRHEHIVSLVGVVFTEPPLAIVMEYLEFGDLRSFLRRNRPMADSPQVLLTDMHMLIMCTQIASALMFLELRKVVHRDVAARCVVFLF